MSVTREAIEDGLKNPGLSIQSQRLVDLYGLGDMNFNTDEAVQSTVNALIELETKKKLQAYKKLIFKDK